MILDLVRFENELVCLPMTLDKTHCDGNHITTKRHTKVIGKHSNSFSKRTRSKVILSSGKCGCSRFPAQAEMDA